MFSTRRIYSILLLLAVLVISLALEGFTVEGLTTKDYTESEIKEILAKNEKVQQLLTHKVENNTK